MRVLFTIVLCSLFCFFLLAESSVTILLDKELEVPRSGFREVHFLVQEDADGELEFQGSFRTSGGFNDDISVLVCTQENFVLWYGKRPHETAMKADKKREGTFRFRAKKGETYYFVLDNFFSTVSNKKVKLLIKLVEVNSETAERSTTP